MPALSIDVVYYQEPYQPVEHCEIVAAQGVEAARRRRGAKFGQRFERVSDKFCRREFRGRAIDAIRSADGARPDRPGPGRPGLWKERPFRQGTPDRGTLTRAADAGQHAGRGAAHPRRLAPREDGASRGHADPGAEAVTEPARDLPPQEAAPRRPAAEPLSEERPERVCPNCGAALLERKCKLLCPEPACGYYLSCSDFY
jgi:hypothetical protein